MQHPVMIAVWPAATYSATDVPKPGGRMCKIYQSDVSAAASLDTITTLGLRRLPMISSRTLNVKIPERAGHGQKRSRKFGRMPSRQAVLTIL